MKAGDAGPDDPADSAGGDAGPQATDHQFVLSAIVLPTKAAEVNEIALDLDGDGNPNNVLGSLVAMLSQDLTIDVLANADASIQSGASIDLVDVRSTSLADASDVRVWIFPGENPQPAPCTDPDNLDTCGQHLDGSGTFDPAGTPADIAPLAGDVAAGAFAGGPGNATLDLDPFGTGPWRLLLIDAQVDWTFDAQGNTIGGLLGGGIPEAEVDDVVLPALHDLFAKIIAVDCAGGMATPCCTAGSDGESLVDIYDADQDCAVSLQELRDSSLISNLLSPDLDLVDSAGNVHPPGNGAKDSVSLGLEISAVGASFDLPDGFGQ